MNKTIDNKTIRRLDGDNKPKAAKTPLYDPNKKYLYRDKIKNIGENTENGVSPITTGIVECFYREPDEKEYPSGKEVIVNFFNLRGESNTEWRSFDSIVLTEIPEDAHACILAAHEEK